MHQDRSIPARIREALGVKTVKKFFPDPTDPQAELGHPQRFDEFRDAALWWLAENRRIEIRDDTTFVIPAEGFIRLDEGPGARVKRLLRVAQTVPAGYGPSGTLHFFEEMTTDWSQGVPLPRGHWHVRNRVFWVAGYGPFRRFDRLYGYDPNLLLAPGPVTFVYWGVPTEAQLADNARFVQACVDYGVHLALNDIIARILRPKHIKLEGVPEIKANVKDYREESEHRKRLAWEAVGTVDVMTGADGGTRV